MPCLHISAFCFGMVGELGYDCQKALFLNPVNIMHKVHQIKRAESSCRSVAISLLEVELENLFVFFICIKPSSY